MDPSKFDFQKMWQLEELEKLKKNLETLPQKIRYESMLPIGNVGLVPGFIEDTNKVLVFLGDSWFVECSCYKATQILDRRIRVIKDGILGCRSEETPCSTSDSSLPVDVPNKRVTDDEFRKLMDHLDDLEEKERIQETEAPNSAGHESHLDKLKKNAQAASTRKPKTVSFEKLIEPETDAADVDMDTESYSTEENTLSKEPMGTDLAKGQKSILKNRNEKSPVDIEATKKKIKIKEIKPVEVRVISECVVERNLDKLCLNKNSDQSKSIPEENNRPVSKFKSRREITNE